ncbi:polyphosphate--glucose phosphotransferase [Sediminivirga luteola]|uniref:Polyphosphate glucokinase n=1 Tax=Sediminivirga luteola TaxID=1774748 RepID=A0A8J2U0B2_9MICO|nr:ROK family protein [Sediminivirga luteola]MCI2263988.1 ROK family protein [Sediminivirga luteola]GGA23188.1 polyphosphate glucokinase [Sediminivirga luteola]
MPKSKQRVIGIGVDIGGTGIKAGLVDLDSGSLLFKRLRVLTPKPSTPEAVVAAVSEVLAALAQKAVENKVLKNTAAFGELPLGVTVPGRIKDGVVTFVGNVDSSWVGYPVTEQMSAVLGHRAYAVNDGDAALLAEMYWGAGRDHGKGVVLMTTLGTGVGGAFVIDGTLFPNVELGQIPMHGKRAEKYMAESIKVAEGLSFEQWASRLQEYYEMLELVFGPDLILIGGGVSKEHEKFLPLLQLKAPIRPAELFNDAGIVGAAYVGANQGKLRLKKKPF